MLHYGHLHSDAIPEIPTALSLVVIVVVLADGHRGEPDQGAPRPEPRAHAGRCATPAAAGGPPIRRPTPPRYTLAPILRAATIGEAWHPQLSDKEGAPDGIGDRFHY